MCDSLILYILNKHSDSEADIRKCSDEKIYLLVVFNVNVHLFHQFIW